MFLMSQINHAVLPVITKTFDILQIFSLFNNILYLEINIALLIVGFIQFNFHYSIISTFLLSFNVLASTSQFS